jgi:putative transposase
VARLRRIVMPGQPHLVIQRSHSAQDVFADARDRDSYLACLGDAAREARVAIHAYGLLPHEVRLLATPDDTQGLSRLVQATGRRFVRQFNQRHGRSGTPWEGRFRSTVIEAGPHFLACLSFVEGLADAGTRAVLPGEAGALHSSAGHHLAGRDDPLIQAHPGYWALGNTPFEREAAYRRFAAQPAQPQTVAAILHAALNGWVLGSDAFAALVAEQAQRKTRPSAPGRRRKSGG